MKKTDYDAIAVALRDCQVSNYARLEVSHALARVLENNKNFDRTRFIARAMGQTVIDDVGACTPEKFNLHGAVK